MVVVDSGEGEWLQFSCPREFDLEVGLKVEVRGVPTAVLSRRVGRSVATAVQLLKGGGGRGEAEPRGGGTPHLVPASLRTRVAAGISVP